MFPRLLSPRRPNKARAGCASARAPEGKHVAGCVRSHRARFFGAFCAISGQWPTEDAGAAPLVEPLGVREEGACGGILLRK